MRYPEFLKEQRTIGLIAPSFGCATGRYQVAFKNAQRMLRSNGFRLDIGPNCYEASGVGISNTPEKCADEFMEYYLSEFNDCLISCAGGELMCEILDYLDFKELEKCPPKWFMGFSDNTNLTFLLTTLCDVATIYGPNAASFGMEPLHESLTDAIKVLKGEKLSFTGYELFEKESLRSDENPLAGYHLTEPSVVKSVGYTQPFTGRLIGGCLDCLLNIRGTKYDKVKDFCEKYKNDGLIWFLESCDLNTMDMRRAMWQLEHSGWFRYVKGFLIGRPYHYGEECLGLNQYDAICAVAGKYGVPILMDVDFGHLPPAIPLICGGFAKVSLQKEKNIEIGVELI